MSLIEPDEEISIMRAENTAQRAHIALLAATATFVRDAPEGKAGRAALLVEIAKVVPK